MKPIAFDKDFNVTYGTAEQVSPMVRRIVCNNPGPFTFTGTGTYIVGSGKVSIIDPGPDDDEHYEALVSAVRGETVEHILVTHTHRDHSPLAKRLKDATGAKVHAFGPHGAGRQSRASTEAGQGLDASGDSDFQPDICVGDGEVIEGSGYTFEAVFTPGHMSNHMAFALNEEQALFCGDHVMAWSTSVVAPPDGCMADYLASLEKVLKRQDKIYWPTHGPEKSEPHSLVRAFLLHRHMRENSILDRIRNGDRSIMDIVKSIYADVDPRLHPAAALSTLAHVEHLIDQGKVRTENTVTLQDTYHAVGN